MGTPPTVLQRANSMPPGPSRGQPNCDDQTRPRLSLIPPTYESVFDQRHNLKSPSTPHPSPRTPSSFNRPRPPPRTLSHPSRLRPSPTSFNSPSTPPPWRRPWLNLPSPVVEDETGELGSPLIDRHRRSDVVDCASQATIGSLEIDHLRRSEGDDSAIQTGVDLVSSSTSSEEFHLLQAENIRLKAVVERETDQVECLKQRNLSLAANFSAKETELDKSKQELQRKTKKKEQVLSHIGQLEDSLNEDGQAREQMNTAAREHRIELNKAKSQIFRSGRKEAEENGLIKILQEENKKLLREKAKLRGKVRDLEKAAKLAVEWKEKGNARINDIAKANKNLQTRISDSNADNIALCKRVEELATSYTKIDETLGDLNVMLKESEGIDVRWHTHFDELVTAHRDLGQALNISPPGSMKSTANNGSLEETASSSRRKRRSNSMPPSSSTASARSAASSVRRLEESPIWPAEYSSTSPSRAEAARTSYPRFSPSRAEMARIFRRSLDGQPRDILALPLRSLPIPILRYGQDATFQDDEERYSASVQPPEKNLLRELEEIGEGLDDPLGDAYVEAKPQHRGQLDAPDQQQRPPAAVEQAEELADDRQNNSTDEPRTNSTDESYTSSTTESDTYLIYENPANLHQRTEERLRQASRVLPALGDTGLLPSPIFSVDRKLPIPRFPAMRNLAKQPGRDTFNEQPRAPTPADEAVVSTDQHHANPADELHSYSIETAEVTGADSCDRTEIPTTIPSAMMSISIQPQQPAGSSQLAPASVGATDQLPPLSEATAVPSPRSPVLTAAQPWEKRRLKLQVRRAGVKLWSKNSPGMLSKPNWPADSRAPNTDHPAELKIPRLRGGGTRSPAPVSTQWTATAFGTREGLFAKYGASLRNRSSGDAGQSLGDETSSPDLINDPSGSKMPPRDVDFGWGCYHDCNGNSSYEMILSKKASQYMRLSKKSGQYKGRTGGPSVKKSSQAPDQDKSPRSLSQDEMSTKAPLVQQPSVLINLPPMRNSSMAQQANQPNEIARAHHVLPTATGDRNTFGDASEPDFDPLMISHDISSHDQKADSTSEPTKLPIDSADMTATISTPESELEDEAEAEDDPVEDDLLHIADLLDTEMDEHKTLSVLVMLEVLEQNPDEIWLARLQATSVTLESGPERKEAIRDMFDEAITQLMEMDGELPDIESLPIPEDAGAASDAQAPASPISPVSGTDRREAIKKMFENATSNINAMESDEVPLSPVTTSSSYSDPEDGQLSLHSGTALDENDHESALALRPIRHVLGPGHLAGALRYHVKQFIASSDPRRWEMTFHPGSLALTSTSGPTPPERSRVDDGHIVGRIEELQEDESALDTGVHSDGQSTEMLEARQERDQPLSSPIHAHERSMSGPVNAQEHSLLGPIFTSDRVQTPGAEPQRAEAHGPTLIETSRHVAVIGLVLGFPGSIISIPVGILNWLYGLARDNQWQTFSWLVLLIAWMIVCDRAQMWFDANNSEYRNDRVRMYYQETWGHPGLEKLTFRVVQWLDLTHEVYGNRLYGP